MKEEEEEKEFFRVFFILFSHFLMLFIKRGRSGSMATVMFRHLRNIRQLI